MNDNPRLQGRIALIAGASRGLGAAAAEALAAEGAHVILVARTQGALEALHDRIVGAGGKATIAPVDLTNGDASDRLALGIADRFQRLDILVQTAAILGVLSPIAHVPPETFEKTLAANVTAHWRLIRNFDALLKRSTGGRAIIATSGAAAGGLAYWAPYAASKAALEAMVSCWAEEVRHTNVRGKFNRPWCHGHRPPRRSLPGRRLSNLTKTKKPSPR